MAIKYDIIKCVVMTLWKVTPSKYFINNYLLNINIQLENVFL